MAVDGFGPQGTIPANTGRICSRATYSRTIPGPSPRIRGELLELKKKMKPDGTIPANTGRIARCPIPQCEFPDHPREYGENGGIIAEEYGNQAPSPRIRGEYTTMRWWKAATRTIPANTGRMHDCISSSSRVRDHPREYGENIGVSDSVISQQGPSPRIRGE